MDSSSLPKSGRRLLSLSVCTVIALSSAFSPSPARSASYQKSDGSIVDPVLCFAAYPGVCATGGAPFTSSAVALLPSQIFNSPNFVAADLHEADLTNVRVFYGVFDSANLSFADLSGGDFSDPGTSLGTRFVNTNLSQATFTGANLTLARMDGANLTSADAVGAIFSTVILDDAVLLGADLTGAFFHYSSLHRADLRFANLSAGKFQYVQFDDAILDNASLIGTYLRYATFPGTSLVNAALIDADLTYSDLSGAHLAGANLSNATLAFAITGPITGVPSALPTDFALADGYLAGPGIDLSDADLTDVDFGDSNMLDVNFRDSNLENASFVGANLQNTDFVYAILINADLTNASIAGASFVQANLSGANLSGVLHQGASLQQAMYDESTVFPSGRTYDLPPWGFQDGGSPWSEGMHPVPEPRAWCMLLAGCGGIVLLGLWHRHQPRNRRTQIQLDS